ncbi:MAG TPA: hypothetical protein PLJ27_03695 [Polyangiaceae bacterium]|jgi:dolichol kinase|nr:MAG: Cytidylyltransferase family protein [Deltaproteobacteria bacterium ADurb.Bin207]HNS98540.1 hypothetical protein [Polyangiaceae bacterium]HNZ21445.1 hypothetical protein [Polyangiaceae bacterium]HOD23762.1 hypothetical protein [Polyangiaceae bacterium]HOE51183.1 hypothetical protein [Polyangiaceae bacterium]
MTQIISSENQRVLLELHALLRDIDPSRWRDGIEAAFRDRLSKIQAGVAQMRAVARTDGKMDAVRERLDELARAVRDFSPSQSIPCKHTLQEEWLTFRKRVAPYYEACAHALQRKAVRVPSLRPTNYARSLFHVFAGLGSIGLLEFVLPLWSLPWVTGVVALTCWVLETTRRIWPTWNQTLFKFVFFKVIAHPREVHHVNSATWYATSLFVLSLLQSHLVGMVALAIMAFADPAAAMIGRRWGRTTLLHGRTLEGSLTFVVVGTAAALLGMHILHPEVCSWPMTLAVGACAAVCGSIAELFSRGLDDNLTVPVSAAAGTVLAAWLTGMPMWG